MTDLEKAARMALEQPAKQRHIAYVCPQCHWTLEEQPAQQEHKPWCASLSALMFKPRRPCDCKRVPLPPPQRKPWVGLTVEEIKNTYFTTRADFVDYARAIEAKLREKNAGGQA